MGGDFFVSEAISFLRKNSYKPSLDLENLHIKGKSQKYWTIECKRSCRKVSLLTVANGIPFSFFLINTKFLLILIFNQILNTCTL